MLPYKPVSYFNDTERLQHFKTVTPCTLNLIFFHKKSKKQEKEPSGTFILLSQSRNMIGRSMDAYRLDQSRFYNFSRRGKLKNL